MPEERLDVDTALQHGLLAGPTFGKEAISQPDRAQLQAAQQQRFDAVADDELARTAADVDEQVALVEQRDRRQHAEVDQPGLLDTGHHFDVHSGLTAGSLGELVAVVGLAHSAGGHRGDARRSGMGSDPSHPAERFDAAIHGVGFEALHVFAARAEPDRLALAGQDLEMALGVDGGDDEVERVRSHVDRCDDAHVPQR